MNTAATHILPPERRSRPYAVADERKHGERAARKAADILREEIRAEVRAVASLNNVELITALFSCNRQLTPIGLQLRIVNGVVSLLTTQVENRALSEYLSEQTGASGNLLLTSATLDALATLCSSKAMQETRPGTRSVLSKIGIAGYSANKTVRLGTKARGYRSSDRLLAFLETL